MAEVKSYLLKNEGVRNAMAGRERTAEAVKQTAIGGEAEI